MAKKTEKTEAVQPVQLFTKKQFLNWNKMARYKDWLSANLQDGKSYPRAEVIAMVEKAFKIKLNIK